MNAPIFHESSYPEIEASAYVISALGHHLDRNEKVLLLLSGGSAIIPEVLIGEKLRGINTDALTIALVDERYGDVGHANSNWQALRNSGFTIPEVPLQSVLQGKNKEDTVSDYNAYLTEALNTSDYIIGIFGVGADGHTAGVLPKSPALISKDLVCGYQANDYYRITTTPSLISRMNEAILYAHDPSKKDILQRMRYDIPYSEMPAQLLKQVSRCTIFSLPL